MKKLLAILELLARVPAFTALTTHAPSNEVCKAFGAAIPGTIVITIS